MVRKLTLSVLLLVGCLMTAPVWAQSEASSTQTRYKGLEASNGQYEEYEVMPRRGSPFLQWNWKRSPDGGPAKGGSGLYSSGINRFKADPHAGLANFQYKRCADCHASQAKNNKHVTRSGVTCRQCHGQGTIQGIEHYYSPMNPIRRHAYVCAKCHQGASDSFAEFVIHEPQPLLAGTAESFPALYWAVWIMVCIAVGTFALFLPHTGLWMLRELFMRKEKRGDK